ncbi:MAG: hypothetical protein AAGE89_07985 [Pseudomonadota bacterium]
MLTTVFIVDMVFPLFASARAQLLSSMANYVTDSSRFATGIVRSPHFGAITHVEPR